MWLWRNFRYLVLFFVFSLEVSYSHIHASTKFAILIPTTVCISDLDLLNLIWRFDFRLKQNFAVDLEAPQKILLALKVVKSASNIFIYEDLI